MDVSIPVNTTAVIYFPAVDPTVIKENSRSITSSKEIKVIENNKNNTIITLGSGDYHFSIN